MHYSIIEAVFVISTSITYRWSDIFLLGRRNDGQFNIQQDGFSENFVAAGLDTVDRSNLLVAKRKYFGTASSLRVRVDKLINFRWKCNEHTTSVGVRSKLWTFVLILLSQSIATAGSVGKLLLNETVSVNCRTN